MLVSALPSTGAVAPGWAEPGARDAVVDAWWDDLLRNPWVYTPVGSTSRCENVALSPAYQRSAADRVSFYRGMAGVDRLVKNPEPDAPAVSRHAGLPAPALRTVGISAMPSQGGPADSLAVSVAVPLREGQDLVLWPPRGHVPRLETPARWSVAQPQGRDVTAASDGSHVR